MRIRTRRSSIVIAGLVGVPLAAMSFAYACTALATLEVDKSAAQVGADVAGTGAGFSNSPLSSPVEVHFNARDGQVLWSGRPAVDGKIAFNFTVPQAAPGDYVLIATQMGQNGQPIGGTPARAPFEVLAKPVAARPAQPAAANQQPAAPAQAPARQGGSAVQPGIAAPAPAAVVAPAPAAAPAAVAAPAIQGAPAAAPAARRSTTMAPRGDGLLLALSLVGIGLALSVGAGTVAVASRRRRPAEARTSR